MVRECEEISERLEENPKKTTQESCELLQNMEFSWNVFSCSAQVQQRGEFTLDYSLVLTVAIQLSFICLYGKTGFCHCPCDCTE